MMGILDANTSNKVLDNLEWVQSNLVHEPLHNLKKDPNLLQAKQVARQVIPLVTMGLVMLAGRLELKKVIDMRTMQDHFAEHNLTEKDIQLAIEHNDPHYKQIQRGFKQQPA